MPPDAPARSLMARLRRRLVAEGDCLLWTGATNAGGYGMIAAGAPSRRTVPAHRAVWEDAHGPIPPKIEITQACGRRLCAAIGHLTAVTPRANPKRRAAIAAATVAAATRARAARSRRPPPPSTYRRDVPRRSRPRPCVNGHPPPTTPAYASSGRRICPECDPGGHALALARLAFAAARPRQARPRRPRARKLSAAAVRELRRRRAAGETQRALGRAFGVSQPVVSRILGGAIWAHVGDA